MDFEWAKERRGLDWVFSKIWVSFIQIREDQESRRESRDQSSVRLSRFRPTRQTLRFDKLWPATWKQSWTEESKLRRRSRSDRGGMAREDPSTLSPPSRCGWGRDGEIEGESSVRASTGTRRRWQPEREREELPGAPPLFREDLGTRREIIHLVGLGPNSSVSSLPWSLFKDPDPLGPDPMP